MLLLALDCATRAWRFSSPPRAAGAHLVSAMRCVSTSTVKPLRSPRIGWGEPARFLGMTWSGLRVVMALVALGVEVAAEWPVFGIVALALAGYYVPDWSEAADRFLSHSLARDLLGIELMVLVALIVIWTLQRLVRPGAIRHRVRRQWRVAWGHVRRAPWWVLFAGALLTVVSLAARALILPALVWGHPDRAAVRRDVLRLARADSCPARRPAAVGRRRRRSRVPVGIRRRLPGRGIKS